MALELIVFGIIAGSAVLLFLSGLVFRIPYLFLFGSVLLFGSGALLWGFDGLNLGSVATTWSDVTNTWTYVPQIVSMANLGLMMLALVLVAVPIISFLVVDMSPHARKGISPFHY